ncbi:hypothetical protein CPHO_10925 [Corynebacterium phocae]|uniref:ATP-grasp domain-containing protein n=1 Tax=Corynebacterium phocae TaxID=161895 RepID=A0A1L7D5D2_9CORY|nr:formate-dependent phosphoribosylglycinamide formyltransferase [Corynebacterium phocae]APT93320.1 hypothetical protein CPHO_10925 [Corynebacterium phocae]KAA8721651.1 formate-dependent phosphoribosylglycinamide formyltransferase [Corynebacterium phocae]
MPEHFDKPAINTPALGDSIGTALTPNATRVMLLGAGELGKEIAGAFQNLGLEVHAVERYHGAPAHQVAQFAHVADINDEEAVWALAQEIRPDVVVPEVEMVSVPALNRLEESGFCTVVPTARACADTWNRASIRQIAESIGLPGTAYKFATSAEELGEAAAQLGFPCIVKSDAATSGRGHVVVHGPEEIAECWANVHRVSTDKRHVVVERFVDFDHEVTLLAVRSVDPATGCLATWFSEPIGHRHEGGDLAESWQPLAISEQALENARSVAARISNELGGRGVYCVELFVSGDDVYFSAVSPRPSDAAMLTLRTQRFSEFDLHARAILGYPIDVTLTSPGAAVVLHAERDMKEVVVSGVREALSFPETDVRVFGKPGAYAGRRLGLVVATADTADLARENASLAARAITLSDGGPRKWRT